MQVYFEGNDENFQVFQQYYSQCGCGFELKRFKFWTGIGRKGVLIYEKPFVLLDFQAKREWLTIHYPDSVSFPVDFQNMTIEGFSHCVQMKDTGSLSEFFRDCGRMTETDKRKDSRQIFENLFENHPEAVSICNMDQKLIYMNRKMIDLFRMIDHVNIRNVCLMFLFNPEEMKRFKADGYLNGVISLNPEQIEKMFHTRTELNQQKRIHYHIRIIKIRNDLFYFMSFSDITETEKIRIEKKRNAYLYDMIFRENLSGVAFLNLKAEITEFNDSLAYLFGIDLKDRISIPEMIDEPFKNQFESEWNQVLNNQSCQFTMTLKMIRKDSSNFWADIKFIRLDHQNLENDEVESFPCAVMMVEDKTSEKWGWKSHQMCEERFRKFFNYLPYGMAFYSEGEVREINTACLKMFRAKTIEDIQKSGIRSFFRAEDLNEIIDKLENAKKYGVSCFIRNGKLIRLDGELFDAEITAVPFSKNEGDDVQIMIRDVSEFKKDFEELKDSVKVKDFLLNEHHHRIRNMFQMLTDILMMEKNEAEKNHRIIISDFIEHFSARVEMLDLMYSFIFNEQNLFDLNGQEFLKEIVFYYIQLYKRSHQVKINNSEDPVLIELQTALPLGIIFFELYTYTLKISENSFLNSMIQYLEINYDFSNSEEFYRLIYSDNIKRSSEEIEKFKQTVPFKMINLLSEQLGGDYVLGFDEGLNYKINF